MKHRGICWAQWLKGDSLLLDWIKSIMNSLGYIGISVLMFLENIFPPLPSELIMPLAGFTAAEGELSLVGVIIAGVIGSVVGQLPLYYLGRSVGEERLKAWADKHGKWLTVSSTDIEHAKEWLDRHGGKAVFLARMVPGIRSLISIPAGIASMNLAKFLLYSTLGIGIWAGILGYLGWLLGENYEKVSEYLGPITYIVLGVIVVVAIGWVWKRKNREKTARQGIHE
jgi:membrane protein DedA with SNARE-associated domain